MLRGLTQLMGALFLLLASQSPLTHAGENRRPASSWSPAIQSQLETQEAISREPDLGLGKRSWDRDALAGELVKLNELRRDINARLSTEPHNSYDLEELKETVEKMAVIEGRLNNYQTTFVPKSQIRGPASRTRNPSRAPAIVGEIRVTDSADPAR